MSKSFPILALFSLYLTASSALYGQQGVNDTLRLGGIEVDGKTYPFIFLPEFTKVAIGLDQEELKRLRMLRYNIHTVYSYALASGTLFREMNAQLATIEGRRERKKYLKTMDRQLEGCFKTPLKNLSIDQGHVLIKLINRQTGQSCYSIIKELKGGFSAMMWQSVGVMFNNNLIRPYEPDGRDAEIERIVLELEQSEQYRYQLYLQGEIIRRVTKK